MRRQTPKPLGSGETRVTLDLDGAGRVIKNFGELIDALSELGMTPEEELASVDLRFPLHFDLEIHRTELGLRIDGY